MVGSIISIRASKFHYIGRYLGHIRYPVNVGYLVVVTPLNGVAQRRIPDIEIDLP